MTALSAHDGFGVDLKTRKQKEEGQAQFGNERDGLVDSDDVCHMRAEKRTCKQQEHCLGHNAARNGTRHNRHKRRHEHDDGQGKQIYRHRCPNQAPRGTLKNGDSRYENRRGEGREGKMHQSARTHAALQATAMF